VGGESWGMRGGGGEKLQILPWHQSAKHTESLRKKAGKGGDRKDQEGAPEV